MKYIFRGIEVFEYIPETGRVLAGKEGDSPAFNFCKFIDEDFILLADYFDNITKHRMGLPVDLKDIIVD